MNPFSFSDQLLEELERVQRGGVGGGRGRIDRKGQRAFAENVGNFIGTKGGGSSGKNSARDGGKSGRSAHAVKQLQRTAQRAPQVMVKITSRIHGAPSTVGAFTYVSRLGMSDQEPITLETSEGKSLTSAADMLVLAREWQNHEQADEARRKGATAIAMVFSMPPGTDAEKVHSAVKEFAETDMANRRWAMALHTDEAHPHVHLIIAARDNDGKRFNPDREFLQNCRERFAELLRDRGVEADATKRVTRAYPAKQDPLPVRKIREDKKRGLPVADVIMRGAITGTTKQGQEYKTERAKQLTKTAENAATVKAVYSRAISELESRGGDEEKAVARSLRNFVEAIPERPDARAEIIERLRKGDALPADFAKDAELEKLKSRVRSRETEAQKAALDSIERLRGLAAERSGNGISDRRGGEGRAPPVDKDYRATLDRLNAAKDALTPSPKTDVQTERLSAAMERAKAASSKLAASSADAATARPDKVQSDQRRDTQAGDSAAERLLKAVQQRERTKQQDRERDRERPKDRDKDGPSR